MNKYSFAKIRILVLAVVLCAAGSICAGPSSEVRTDAEKPEDENSRDLFTLESTYTFRSDFRQEYLGSGDSRYTDLSYDHRFLIKGKWFLRTGIEYERFDFGGTENGLPDQLQTFHGHLAIEYVVHDRAGAGFEIDPGVYFQDHVSGEAFDVPWKLFVSFPVKKDKIFGVIGVGGSSFQDPPVAPGGGIIWLFSDNLRLEGVFPKPALVYSPNDDWQFRLMANLLYEGFRTEDVVTSSRKLQLHDAAVQYSENSAGFEARYSGWEPFKIRFGAGYTFRREFDFFRAERRAKIDPAPYLRLSLEARF